MRCLCLFLMFFVTGSLFAGRAQRIKKDDEKFKNLSMSVDVKEHPKDANKLVFTVKMKASDLDIYLRIEDKSQKLTPVVTGDVAEINFEIEKSSLEKTDLHLTNQNGSNCPPSYFLGLRQFIL